MTVWNNLAERWSSTILKNVFNRICSFQAVNNETTQSSSSGRSIRLFNTYSYAIVDCFCRRLCRVDQRHNRTSVYVLTIRHIVLGLRYRRVTPIATHCPFNSTLQFFFVAGTYIDWKDFQSHLWYDFITFLKAIIKFEVAVPTSYTYFYTHGTSHVWIPYSGSLQWRRSLSPMLSLWEQFQFMLASSPAMLDKSTDWRATKFALWPACQWSWAWNGSCPVSSTKARYSI